MAHHQEKEMDKRKARPYQVEIVEKALKQNTIVCLGTGTGKTYISATVIKELQGGIRGTHAKNGKRTFFLVNTVPLVRQQADEIRRVSCLKVSCYTGDMGVDFWDRERWIKEFDENDVLVMTAQILVNILTHAFIGLHNINLIVLDECHNASKKHPYANLMAFHDKCPRDQHPRILGLTASIINEKYKGFESGIQAFLQGKMKALESTMRSVCITCADPQATSMFATKPEELIETYSSDIDTNGYDDVVQMSDDLQRKLGEAEERYKKQHKTHKANVVTPRFSSGNNSGSYEKLLFGMFKLKIADVFLIASDAAKYCGEILKELGPLSAYEAANVLHEQIEKYKQKRLDDVSRTVFQEVGSVLMDVISCYEKCIADTGFQTVENVIPMEPFITKKAYTFLSQILLQQQLNFKTEFGTDLHAIVFVERRCTAVILSNLINYQAKTDPDTFGKLKSNYVLGHAMEANIHLADGLMRSNKQNEILSGFKNGEFNVLVSTSVVEEGLDVRKCNLVVRFDGIGNFRQYAQSKGRARSKNSKFIIMTPESYRNKMKVDLKILQEIEKILYEKCRRVRDGPTEQEMEDALYAEEKEYVPTYYVDDGPDPARITRNTCVSLLHRFCNSLPSDQYSCSRPFFEYETRGHFDEETRAKVLLPTKVPLEERVVTGYWVPDLGREVLGKNAGEVLAKKSVCMLVCILLHTLGVLDEHLLITADADEEEEEEEEEELHEPRTGKVNLFHQRKIPTVLSPRTFDNYNLYAISVVLSEPRDNPGACALWPFWFDEERKGFGIILPSDVPPVLPEIMLYTRAGGLCINLIKLICHLDFIPEHALEYHQYIMQMCSEKYVNSEMYFDFDDPRVSKGILVPLNADVLNKINHEIVLKKCDGSSIDFDTLRNYKQHEQDILENSVIQKTYLDDKQNQRLYYVTGLSHQKAGDIMEGTVTYTDYYLKKYERFINPSSYMLEAIPISSKVSYTENLSQNEFNKKTRGQERLAPELCKIVCNVDAYVHQQMVLLPYISYMYECILNADELRHHISTQIGISHDQVDSKLLGIDMDSNYTVMSRLDDVLRLSNKISDETLCPNVMDILESITSRQARFPFDYERLEMLGDSLLKMATTVFLYFKYPVEQEGKLAGKRTKSIENKNLFRIAEKIGIQNIICNSQFGNVNENNMNKNSVTVWLPPGYLRVINEDSTEHIEPYQEVRTKTMADCIEALIGVYFKTGGINLALKFMQEYLNLNVLFSKISEDDGRAADITRMPSFYADFPLANNAISNSNATYDDVKKLYKDWKFSRLEQNIGYKFRDKSYLLQAMKHESYYLNTVTNCYERLEFLGDAVLDFLVTLHVFMEKTRLNPGELTSIRSALVNNNTFALLVIKHKFDIHIKHFSPDFDANLKEFKAATRFYEDEQLLDVCFKNPFVIIPKDSKEGYHAPKILGDIFEAITGAVFLDCHMNLVKVWEVIYPLMKDIIDAYMIDIPLNPVRQFIEKYSDAKWTYGEDDGDTVCTAHFDNGRTAVGIGKNKKMAKATASWKAVHPE